VAAVGTTAVASQPRDRLAGALLLCAGTTIFSLQDVAIKWVSGRYPVSEILAVRGLVASVLLLALVRFDGGLVGIRTRRLGRQLVRAGLLLVSYTAYYLAIAAIPLAEAVSLYYSAPLFIVLLSGPLLGERVGPARWLAVLLGFAGVVVVLRPGSGVMEPAALLSVASAVFYGAAALMARRLGRTERASVMAFYQNVVFLAAALVMGLLAGGGGFAGAEHASLQFLLRAWAMPPPVDLLLIASTGIVGALGSWLLTFAYRIAEANIVAPFEYTAIVWAVIWGWLVWSEIPGIAMIAGIALVIAAGLIVLRSAHKR
jgi:drug/metabolite transporter (DMT)-like permease